MSSSGRCRNSRPPAAASFNAVGAPDLERIERSQPARAPEIEAHDDDRYDGEGGGQRDVAGGALVDIDRLADEEARGADDLRDDVIAQRQREGEDRAGDDARQRQRQYHRGEGLARRSEERRVGKEGGSTCRTRWSPNP